MGDRDSMYERYLTINAFLMLPVIFLAFINYNYISAIISESILNATGFVAAAIAIIGYVVVGIVSYRKYHCFPHFKQCISTLLISLLPFPFLMAMFVLTINCCLDDSSPVTRNTVIVEKNESVFYKKNNKIKDYSIYVKSWRPDMDKIKIKVNSGEFSQLKKGDNVTLRTKPGFCGIEFFVENK